MKPSPFHPFKQKQINEVPFSLGETVEALIVAAGQHEGIWTLGVKMDLSVTNLEIRGQVCPVSVAGLTGFTLLRVSSVQGNAVDAALCNPKQLVKLVH